MPTATSTRKGTIVEEQPSVELNDVDPDLGENEEEMPDDVEDEEIIPPETELWPGGPTKAMVDSWKDQHGDVYVTSIGSEKHFVWRCLTRFEYRRLVKNLEQSIATGQVTQAEANMNNEEAVTEVCVLYPPITRVQLAGEMAGVASIISQECMESSGFVASEVRML